MGPAWLRLKHQHVDRNRIWRDYSSCRYRSVTSSRGSGKKAVTNTASLSRKCVTYSIPTGNRKCYLLWVHITESVTFYGCISSVSRSSATSNLVSFSIFILLGKFLGRNLEGKSQMIVRSGTKMENRRNMRRLIATIFLLYMNLSHSHSIVPQGFGVMS